MLDSDAGVTVGQGVESNPMTEVGSPRKKCSAREDLRIDSVSCLPPDSVQRTAFRGREEMPARWAVGQVPALEP